MAADDPNVRIPPNLHRRGQWEWRDRYFRPVHPCPAFFNYDRRTEQSEDNTLFQGLPGGGGGGVGLVSVCGFGFGLGLAFVVFLESFAIEFII